MSERLSRNFMLSEFTCPCCGAGQMNYHLIAGLQFLRDRLGVALHINSGFRCPAHNKAVGGVVNSNHLKGLAADVACPAGYTPDQLAEEAENIPEFANGGIGIYPEHGFVHLDVGRRSRWRK